MSKIRLHGSSSGYTEIAPVAASGNNTLTLPNDGTIISKDSNGAVGVTSITVGTGVTVGDGRVTATTFHGSGANLTGIVGGITVAQQFRQTTGTTTSGGENFLTSNWEKSDSTAQGGYGSFADPSSGIFTFPTTGYYLVTFTSYFEDSGYSTLAAINILATTDNSSYGSNAQVYFGTNYDQTGNNYAGATCSTIVDVTDTSQVKVKFRVYSNGDVSWDGSNGENRTHVTFIRLGDT